MSENNKMDKVVSLAKRRGFVYQGSEIYDGMAGIYDYGPRGVALASNLKNAWWKEMVQKNPNIVGLDSSIFTSPKVWEASGHTKGFSDPLVECKQCGNRMRADHLLEDIGVESVEGINLEEMNQVFDENREKLICSKCGEKNFGEVKNFNLLVKSNLGNFSEAWNEEPVYLRGETCQGIYINFKNVMDTGNVKIPFGIAQIGKAFRNEISPRQYIFRKREFEQMEMQYFVRPEDEMSAFEEWKKRRMEFYKNLGFSEDNLRFKEHDNLVFYAKAAFDVEYKYPFDFKELEGVHARGDYDLTQHQTHSGVDLSVLDPQTNERFIPHVVETSVGVDRMFLATMCEFYDEDELNGEHRVVMRFPKKLAPARAAVFPLLKNKPQLVAKAREVFEYLAEEYVCEWDDNGNIGKRYRRQDEIGTPYCITIDFDTLGEEDPLNTDTVTVRDRDTGEQERVAIAELINYLK